MAIFFHNQVGLCFFYSVAGSLHSGTGKWDFNTVPHIYTLAEIQEH